jgi:hypothetical protein
MGFRKLHRLEILERRENLPVSAQFQQAAAFDAFNERSSSDLFVILTAFQLKGEGLKEGEQLPKEVFTEFPYL